MKVVTAQDPHPPLRLAPALPTIRRAQVQTRHLALFLSFWICVAVPVALSGWYLYERAADQYASRVGFVVRAQDTPGEVGIWDGVGALVSRSGGSDTDILNEFIHSQKIVERIDARLDLRTLYSRPKRDPVFAFDAAAPMEDLVTYWRRMVAVQYDSTTGLIELRITAFSAEDSVAIAREILGQSSEMINRLNDTARRDSTRYAREELDVAVARLKAARQALTQFRTSTQIVDPSADVKGQMTVLVSLQQQLAEAYVELDLLIENSSEQDARVRQLRKQVEVIERRIDAERRKFGLGTDGDAAYATVLARFEELSVDLEFAQSAYVTAMTTYDLSLRTAQRQNRYLATYLSPTEPQSAEFPKRATLLGLVALFVFLIWSVMTLVYYSLRDRG